MLSSFDFTRQSLELHLFFLRIMKEHSFFLELGFTPRDSEYTKQADEFRREFDQLLRDVVAFSGGIVSPEVINSGEVFTPYTLNAEMASTYFTGIQIPTDITKAEMDLVGDRTRPMNQRLERTVYDLNERAIELVSLLIKFKTLILSNVLSCKMYTVNYPLLIDHILREAKMYLKMIQQLQRREKIDTQKEILDEEAFWNTIMAEHAKFIRGLLDPSEDELIKTADNFGNEFDQLTKEAKAAMNRTIPVAKVTADSLAATKEIRDFKTQGTKGILDCKVKSIIIPLLGDHTIREANHFLRMLKSFSE